MSRFRSNRHKLAAAAVFFSVWGVLPLRGASDTAVVRVNARIVPSVAVEVVDNEAWLSVMHASPEDVSAWVEVESEKVDLRDGEWVCLYDCTDPLERYAERR